MSKYGVLVSLFMALFSSGLVATDVTADITGDVTWNFAGSPYNLKKVGGDIYVKSGATLTIDSTLGAVVINWEGIGGSNDFDLLVGNGSSDLGTIKLKGAANSITFNI